MALEVLRKGKSQVNKILPWRNKNPTGRKTIANNYLHKPIKLLQSKSQDGVRFLSRQDRFGTVANPSSRGFVCWIKILNYLHPTIFEAMSQNFALLSLAREHHLKKHCSNCTVCPHSSDLVESLRLQDDAALCKPQRLGRTNDLFTSIVPHSWEWGCTAKPMTKKSPTTKALKENQKLHKQKPKNLHTIVKYWDAARHLFPMRPATFVPLTFLAWTALGLNTECDWCVTVTQSGASPRRTLAGRSMAWPVILRSRWPRFSKESTSWNSDIGPVSTSPWDVCSSSTT